MRFAKSSLGGIIGCAAGVLCASYWDTYRNKTRPTTQIAPNPQDNLRRDDEAATKSGTNSAGTKLK